MLPSAICWSKDGERILADPTWDGMSICAVRVLGEAANHQTIDASRSTPSHCHQPSYAVVHD
jgi:hypothetical protein